MMTSRRVIVTGLVGLYPVGGVAWDYLQYVIGLMRLGHDVYYYEDTWSWPYHPVERRPTEDGGYSALFLKQFFERYAPELCNRWHYLHLHQTGYGMSPAAFQEVAQAADLFLNISGACMIPDHLSSHCVKVFVDTDPGYNQILLSEKLAWSENVDRWCTLVAEHDRHLTYAENIGASDCLIPNLDFDWKTTRMPVVLDYWKPSAAITPPDDAAWTTVMTWNAFKGPLVYKGVEYFSKGFEFEKVIDLPGQVGVRLKVAVGGRTAPMERLSGKGWEPVDGPAMTLTPESYQSFIAGSRGEFSVAKHVYIAMRSGWFSCRSACYLASGRPVVVQDTGFSQYIPTGFGLMSFNTLAEAVEAIETVEGDFVQHTRAARKVAETYFDAQLVLLDLLKKVNLD